MVTLPTDPLELALGVAAGLGVVALAAEALHARRVLQAAPLAFGPARRRLPLAWVAAALRVLAVAATGWGLAVLVALPPAGPPGADPVPTAPDTRHLVLVLDVSPSMQLKDAGPTGELSRAARAAEVVRAVVGMAPAGRTRVTVVAAYTAGKPVVLDTADRELAAHLLTVPLRVAFTQGETDLLSGITEAAKVAAPFPAGSAGVVVVTDGDTVPPAGMPPMPASVGANVLVVGVGSPTGGKSIAGHTSRQDVATLQQIASRLVGTYHDGNVTDPPAGLMAGVAAGVGAPPDPTVLRERGLAAAAAGAGVLAVLPAVLLAVGTGRRAVRSDVPMFRKEVPR